MQCSRGAALEGGAQQGSAEQGGCRGQAGGHKLTDRRVHGAVGRQAARLRAQLPKQVEALCMQQVKCEPDSPQNAPAGLFNRGHVGYH